jgi:hypothetical protein
VTPQKLLEAQRPERIRATLRDQTQFTFELPAIQGDTLYGWDEKRLQRRRVALENVEHVATRHLDAGKTALLVLGTAAAAVVVAGAALVATIPKD